MYQRLDGYHPRIKMSIWSGRPGLALNSLFASALILTLLNPLILWDVGFQLSFMALWA